MMKLIKKLAVLIPLLAMPKFVRVGISVLVNLSVFFIMFCVILVLGELVLRWSGYQKFSYSWSWAVRGYFEPDHNRIYRLSKSIESPLHPEESTDSLGFRQDPEDLNQMKKPLIIFMVGDSFTYGREVDNNQTYPYVAQKNLHEAVDIVNAGVSGYGLDQTYLYIRELLGAYNPDYIVWNITMNDLGDANDACLFKEIFPDVFVRFPTWLQTLYLQGITVRKSPKFIQNSSLVNLLLLVLQRGHDRYTIGCTLPYEKKEQIVTRGLRKLTFFMRQLQKFTQAKKTKILYVLNPVEFYFDPINFPLDGREMDTYGQLVNTVSKETSLFWDMNKEIAEIYFPSVLAQRQKIPLKNLALYQPQGFSNPQALGASTLDTRAFFLQQDSLPIGERHLSVLGNQVLGQRFAELFISRFVLSP